MSPGLDFSGLSDDQLVELVREACQEAVRRNPAVEAATRQVMIDEAERARVAREAATAETAVLRARERERIAREAAEQVRRADEEANRARRQAEAEAEADRAREAAEASQRAAMSWLRRAAEAANGRKPSSISLLKIKTNYGNRVLLNPGSDRYQRDHLADYNIDRKSISTTKDLVKCKPALAALLAEFAALHPGNIHIAGADYPWREDER